MYTINLTSIRCNNEVNEFSASEEPYVLVTAVKLADTLLPILDLPTFEVYLYGPWENTDAGETKRNTRGPFWGATEPEDISTDDSTIFIVSLMENDNADPVTYRVLAKAAAATSLASTLTEPSRDRRAEILRTDIRDALRGPGAPLDVDDDHVASIEFRVLRSDLPTTAIPVNRTFHIRNREGNYNLNFSIRNHSFAYISELRCSGNPVMIQSRFGRVGNFELITPLADGGLASYFRENDLSGTPWRGPSIFGASARIDAVTFIQSTYRSPGDFEVVARVRDRLQFFRRDSGPAFAWSGPEPLVADTIEVTGVSGNPVLIQTNFGSIGRGLLHLVVPLARGGVAQYVRDTDPSGTERWRQLPTFGAGLRVESLTLIQSRYGTPGNLEVIARVGGRLLTFWRDSGPGFRWNGPEPLTVDSVPVSGATSNPVLIQNHFGAVGRENFELVVPLSRGLAQFVRENATSDTPRWRRLPTFASGLRVEAITMIQRIDPPANLELVARVGARLVSFWRDSGPGFVWHGPNEI